MPHGQLARLSSRRTIETNITQQGHHARAMRAVGINLFPLSRTKSTEQMFSLTRSW